MSTNTDDECDRIKAFLLENPHQRMVARSRETCYYRDNEPVYVTEYRLPGYGGVTVECVRQLLKERILRTSLISGEVEYVAGINLTKAMAL